MSINIIGVTGPSGAGKSSFCDCAQKKNIPYIDADRVYHSLLTKGSECTLAIVSEFGDGILAPDGTPDRKKLGEIVFSSNEKLDKLNKIVLRFVIREIETLIDKYEEDGEKNVIVDAPTLVESGFNRDCHAVVSILSPKEDRIERICQRDGITRERAEARVAAQKSDEFYIDNSDFILINDKNIEKFQRQTEELLDLVLKN